MNALDMARAGLGTLTHYYGLFESLASMRREERLCRVGDFHCRPSAVICPTCTRPPLEATRPLRTRGTPTSTRTENVYCGPDWSACR